MTPLIKNGLPRKAAISLHIKANYKKSQKSVAATRVGITFTSRWEFFVGLLGGLRDMFRAEEAVRADESEPIGCEMSS